MRKSKKTAPEKKAINVTLPIFVSDAGDGSAVVFVFKTLPEAEKAAEAEAEAGNPCFTDNVFELDLTISEEGEILSGFEDIEEFVSDRAEDDLILDDTDEDLSDEDEESDEDSDDDVFSDSSDEDEDEDYLKPDEEEM